MPFPSVETVRPAAALTNSYVAGQDVRVSGANQIVLFLTITKASITRLELKVEIILSAIPDRQFQEVSGAAGKGVNTLRPLEYHIYAADLGADASRYLYLPIPVLGDAVRVSAKAADGDTVTGSSLAISAAAGMI